MKNRRLETLINLLLLAVWLVVFGVLVVYAKINFNMSGMDAFMLSVTGFVLHYVFSLLFHELGHVIFLKLLKMKLQYVNFGLFSIDFTAGKFRLFTYFSSDAGETAFLPTKDITHKEIKLVAFGGILFSFIYAIAGIAPLFFIISPEWFCVLGVGACSAFYLLTINLLPIDKTSDGSILISRKDYPKIVAAIVNHQRREMQGEIPPEAEIFKSSTQPLACYYHYLYLLLQNRKEEAFYVINKLSLSLDDFIDDEYQLIFPEIITVNFLQGIKDKSIMARAEVFFNEEDPRPAVIRAHCIFRSSCGETDWSESLRKAYEKSLRRASYFTKEIEKHFNF